MDELLARKKRLGLESMLGCRDYQMKTISIDIPESAVFSVSASDEEFARGLRLAAAIFWYDEGLISQGPGSRTRGLDACRVHRCTWSSQRERDPGKRRGAQGRE